MSQDVIFYQIAIAIFIIAASILIGLRGMVVTAAIATIWTIVMVFTKWLFILQLLTIMASSLVGAKIFTSENFKVIRSFAWKLLRACVAVCVFLIAIIWLWTENKSSFPSQQRPSVVSQPAPVSSDAAVPLAAPPVALSESHPEMEAAIASIERRYPTLDVNSPMFDENVTDRVLARQKQLMDQNRLTPVSALIQASDEVMGTYYNSRDDVILRCRSRNGGLYSPPCKYGESELSGRGH